jgi:hypothetical protein
MFAGGLLFAENASLTSGIPRALFEWGRIQSPGDWLPPLVVGAAILLYVVWMYRRDSVELRRPVGVLLTVLRMAAFVGLLIVYLEPQWRNEIDQVQNSRVLLLVDTSLSMGLDDDDSSSVSDMPNRLQKIVAALEQGDFLRQLREKHDVEVLRFDQNSQRLASLAKRPAENDAKRAGPAGGKDSSAAVEDKMDWLAGLAPRGAETRLGQALGQWIETDRGAGPISGVVVFTDGQQNAGLDPAAAVELAREARIPIYAVGVGSLEQPVNVRISDFVAPARAYPGDRYAATGYLQAQGLAGKTVAVELFSRSAGTGSAAANEQGVSEGMQQVVLGGDGEVVPVKFELVPNEVGRRTLRLKVRPPSEDRYQADDQQEVDIEVVDRKTKVLLFAGGPSREYQFLRNQLRRDKDVIVDVLLQTAAEGISQDANAILEKFPETGEQLFAYDAIVAFDPDWRVLSSAQQELVERWVGDQAGGLIAIAGPIYADRCAQDPNLARIRALYPVEFNRRFSLLDDSRYGSKEPWPIEFTRDGLEAEFLWIEDSGPSSARAWSEFAGVFGFFSVRGPKPGATVYGRFSDPRAADGGQQPVYMAGQFYGAGRAFYLGSGEMWRLRADDEAYFERFYTKLVRHVTQGRLLRGSHRGVLLVERDRYLLGGTVDVRAQLSNSRLEPLELPRVSLEVTSPDNSLETVALAADPSRAGTYRGQFALHKEGVYRLELPVPESDNELLTRRIQVRVPDLEREHPQRNDALLNEIAAKTGGVYYIGLESALGVNDKTKSLPRVLRDQSRTITTVGKPTPLWATSATICVICGLLCLEWLIRRLVKLA